MEEETKTTRVRANFSTNSKGQASIDVTCEAPTVEEMSSLMTNAIDSFESILTEKQIPMIHRVIGTDAKKKLED